MSANGMVRPCSRPASSECWQGAPKTKEHAMSQKLDTSPAVIGIDIGKNSFHIVGQNQRGAIVLRQKWSRGQVEARPTKFSKTDHLASTITQVQQIQNGRWVLMKDSPSFRRRMLRARAKRASRAAQLYFSTSLFGSSFFGRIASAVP